MDLEWPDIDGVLKSFELDTTGLVVHDLDGEQRKSVFETAALGKLPMVHPPWHNG
jgi:hypothetical protein